MQTAYLSPSRQSGRRERVLFVANTNGGWEANAPFAAPKIGA